jgi:hypothetical protein
MIPLPPQSGTGEKLHRPQASLRCTAGVLSSIKGRTTPFVRRSGVLPRGGATLARIVP